MNKKDLSEADIKAKFITPAILKSGWDEQTQIGREIFFTDGRIHVKGKLTSRGKGKFADYILYYKPNLPIAVIEAKDNKHNIQAGIQQALNYAYILDIPCVFSSNGDGFCFHDRTCTESQIEKELSLEEFPTPDELWKKYKLYKGIETQAVEAIASQDYFYVSGKSPRYYQQIAINRTVEAVAKNQKRIILVMATGTGKTYTAFQIIYRLWKSGLKKRILFLADRTALIDQTVRGDFKHFKEAMTVVKNKKIDTAYHIYLALYQGLSDSKTEDAYKQFSRKFFDLVIIDECHRGSAREDSKWREILDYFDKATHIGLTATPKETETISNQDYFGTPIYTYSLKQGIDDGFLAPYKVIKITLDIDAEGWRPPLGFKDKEGNFVEDKIYHNSDFDSKIVVEERRQLVANKITEFLKGYDRFAKTIVFCVDIEHAEGMRTALVNVNADLVVQNSKYVMQITGDNEEGKRELGNFIDPSEIYPVIATTSKLMTTGIDAQTCKLIVLDKPIKSMTEFKQMIGRGTRINEEYEKYYFTIMDFRNVTHLFADADFDGHPEIVKTLSENENLSSHAYGENDQPVIDSAICESKMPYIIDSEEKSSTPRKKIIVNGVSVTVINERVQYLGSDGKIITEHFRDYTKRNIYQHYRSLNDFLIKWNSADRKTAIIQELEKQGILFDWLVAEIGKDFDPFDMICYIAYEQPLRTRRERAERVKQRDCFSEYSPQAQAVIISLLEKYADEGLMTIESSEILRLPPLNTHGSPFEIMRFFGNTANYSQALTRLEQELYKVA